MTYTKQIEYLKLEKQANGVYINVAKALKAKIEGIGCGDRYYCDYRMSVFICSRIEGICPDCQDAIKELKDILKCQV